MYLLICSSINYTGKPYILTLLIKQLDVLIPFAVTCCHHKDRQAQAYSGLYKPGPQLSSILTIFQVEMHTTSRFCLAGQRAWSPCMSCVGEIYLDTP